MTPDRLLAWQEIFRYVVVTLVAAFLLIWQGAFAATPNPYVIGAGLTLFGLTPALMLDKRRRRGGSNQDDDDDPYAGPGGYYRGGE